jgi:hypothetical protein
MDLECLVLASEIDDVAVLELVADIGVASRSKQRGEPIMMLDNLVWIRLQP